MRSRSAAHDTVEARAMSGLGMLAKLSGALSPEPFVAAIEDFYLTNPIARASAVMAECSALARARTTAAAAAE